MMDFTKTNYLKEYAPNSRETFRRFSVHQLVQAGIVLYNPDDSSRPVNSPKAVYQISPAAFDVIKTYGTKDFEPKLQDFLKNQQSLSKQYAHEREMNKVSVKIKDEHSIQISPGKHSELIKDIIEQLAPRFLPNSTLVYIGDTGENLVFISAFPDRNTFVRFAHDIAWETEAWIADNPDHMIHFNGDKFIGPHK